MSIEIVEVQEDTEDYQTLLRTAARLEQAKYITSQREYYENSLLIGAFEQELPDPCVGFLRLVIQVIGREEGRPPIYREGALLREGFVEAFGVVPDFRRRGIGQQMQEHAMALCRARGCYQIRSRSPITSMENYALKLKMGYSVHPSTENDSYYFAKVLEGETVPGLKPSV